MFQQRTWILQRANIEILRECQRFIMDQFSEKLSLTQKDLIEKIFYFSNQSQNKPFHDAVERLKHSLIEAAFDFSQLPEYDATTLSEQPAVVDTPEMSSQVTARQEPVAKETPKKRTRMYRGREVIVDTPPDGYDKPAKDLKAAPEVLLGEPLKPAAKTKRMYRGREL